MGEDGVSVCEIEDDDEALVTPAFDRPLVLRVMQTARGSADNRGEVDHMQPLM